MADKEIVLRGRSDLSPITRGLSKVDNRLGLSSRSWARIGRVAKAGALGALGATVALAGASVKLAEGAAQDEQGVVKLATAIRNNTDAKRKDTAQTDRYITAQGKLYGVADDDLRPAISRLVAATHNLRKARNLTTLSENVAAGTGKSLEQVTTAVAKAQLGSLGGLARLGVRTKDAAGNTLSLQQVTRQLAQTYRGQAAKAAQTASGQYARLTVALNETGESIGYALLPAATKLVTFINNKGVPTARALWREYERNGLDGVVRKVEDLTGAQGKLTPLLEQARDVGADLAHIFTGAVVPAFEDGARVLPVFVSPLKLAVDLTGFLADHTTLAKVALETFVLYQGYARVATLASNAATSTGIGVLKAYATQTKLTAEQTAFMGKVTKGVAGVAGIAAMTASAQSSSKAINVLGSVAGGALIGSAFGPEGALIGGAAGAVSGLLQLSGQSKSTAKVLDQQAPSVADYASTLDQITGAATSAARAQARLSLENSGAIKEAQQLGISTRDLVDYSLGQEAATKRVNAVLRKYTSQTSDLTRELSHRDAEGQIHVRLNSQEIFAAKNLAAALGAEVKKRREDADAIRDNAVAVDDLRVVFKGLPRKVITQLKTDGTPQTLAEVRKLTKQFDLTPRDVKILVRGLNIATTGKDVTRLATLLTSVNKTKADITPFARGLADQLGLGTKKVKQGVDATNQLLHQTGSGPLARPAFGDYLGSITTANVRARALAQSGGREVGSNLGAGVTAGLRAVQASIAAQAAANVRRAIQAMRNEAQTRSPSKVTTLIGVYMGRGLVDGMAKQQAPARKGGHDLIAATLEGVINGSKGVSASLDKLGNLIEHTFATRLAQTRAHLRESGLKGAALDKAISAAEKRSAAAQRTALKSLRDEEHQLTLNGKAQDRNTAKLDAARQKYAGLVKAAKDYASSIRDAFTTTANVTQLGQQDDGTVSLVSLLDQLRDREANAKRFAALIRRLRKQGLGQAAIQQLLDSGPEAGLATAEAIASGGRDAIKQINALQQSIAKSGQQLGDAMAKTFKQAGIDAAAGLVHGLEDRQRDLDKVADRLANRLVDAVKKALGIKSPSRVFRQLGDQTMQGLALGLDQTYARTLGERVATNVKAGYARPILDTTFGGTLPTSAPREIILTLTADALDQLGQSRKLTATIDLGAQAGTRVMAVRKVI